MKKTFLIMMLPWTSIQAENYKLTFKAHSSFFYLGASELIVIRDVPHEYKLYMNRNIYIPGIIKDVSRAEVQGKIIENRLYPTSFHQTRIGKELTRTTEISWSPQQVIVELDPPFHKNSGISSNKNIDLGTLDPISTIYQVVYAVNHTTKCDVRFFSLDGVSTMDISVTSLEPKNIKLSLYKGEAIGCLVTMKGTSGLVLKGGDIPSIMYIWFVKPDGFSEYIPAVIKSFRNRVPFSMTLMKASRLATSQNNIINSTTLQNP